ncbi:MAG: metalloregulator ArsR/SmtB family transcription factor [Gemmatimonadaceae bacterium]
MASLGPEHRTALDVSTELAAKYFRALGDATRLRILEMLMDGPLTVTELTHALRCPQSSVSNHLACLKWCGFVTSESRGKWSHYAVANPNIRNIVELGRLLVAENAEHVAACTRIGEST